MFQGFYHITSGVLSQQRKLEVVSNNMANISTPGYKSDEMTIRSFGEEMTYRMENYDKSDPVAIGAAGKMVVADRLYTDHTIGFIKSSANPLDFALLDPGFFVINGTDGPVYTRDGSFSLDEQGFLVLQGFGRVQGVGGDIFLGTDKISVDPLGNIYDETGANILGTLRVVDFADYDADLVKDQGTVFTAIGEPVEVTEFTIRQNAVEVSNVEPIDQMTAMLAAQRALQSNSQILRMYDELSAKVVSRLGVM